MMTRHSLQIGFRRNCDFRRSAPAALCTLAAMITAATAQASFTTIMGRGGSYCLVSSQEEFMPEPCVVEETQYFGCYVSTYPICTTEGYWGELTTVDASAVEPNSWGFYATSRYILEGDIWLESALSVTGDRVSQHVFHISGDFQFYQCMLFHACQHIEIALIRFSGDPAAFDAVDPKSVYDLVAANLIDDTDVLFVQTDFPSTSDQLTPLEIDVPVTGIRDEHLYLFSTFETPLPEPGGPVSLGVGALALAGLARRRSRSVRSSGSSR